MDAANHNRQSLKNLIGIMYSKEDILFKALQVSESRAERWCKKVRGGDSEAQVHIGGYFSGVEGSVKAPPFHGAAVKDRMQIPTWTVPCRSPVWSSRPGPCSPIWPRPGR